MACGSCKTCAARCSNHPASYGHTPSRRPSPMISQKPSEPLHTLTLKPEPALADLHRIPDATIRDHRARTGDPTHRDRINEQYLFMRLPTRGKAVYQALWLPLQNMLSSSELEQLFWLDLVQRDPRVKQTETYIAQQARLDRFTS